MFSMYKPEFYNLVEAHCYGKGMTGQFLSEHVAVKQIEGKTFRPRRSSSVTILNSMCP